METVGVAKTNDLAGRAATPRAGDRYTKEASEYIGYFGEVRSHPERTLVVEAVTDGHRTQRLLLAQWPKLATDSVANGAAFFPSNIKP